MIDEFYDYCYGELEYRSLRFETEVLDMGNYQGNAVVNYTDYEVPYTRIIEHTCKEYFICLCSQFFSVCKEICIQTYLYTLQKFLHNTCISTFGDSLIRIFEIVIIISITQRQSFYDKCLQIFTLPAPLLPCISLYQFLIYVLSNQCKRLFLQVLRMNLL